MAGAESHIGKGEGTGTEMLQSSLLMIHHRLGSGMGWDFIGVLINQSGAASQNPPLGIKEFRNTTISKPP